MSEREQPSEPVTATIAERVRQLRLARGMSQERLAAEMAEHGIPWRRSSVVELERRAPSSRSAVAKGRDVVTVAELRALSAVFGVEPAELWAEQTEGAS